MARQRRYEIQAIGSSLFNSRPGCFNGNVRKHLELSRIVIWSDNFLSRQFAAEVCAILHRHSVNGQGLPLFLSSVLTGESLSRVDRFPVSWIVYHSTHIPRILVGRIT